MPAHTNFLKRYRRRTRYRRGHFVDNVLPWLLLALATAGIIIVARYY